MHVCMHLSYVLKVRNILFSEGIMLLSTPICKTHFFLSRILSSCKCAHRIIKPSRWILSVDKYKKCFMLFLWKYNVGIPLFHSGDRVLFFRQSLKASPYRRPAQVFAGRLLVLAGADGGEIARRHGGQREEET